MTKGKNIKFFIPSTKPSELQDVYLQMMEVLKDQLRVVITKRRIYSITYTQDKKELSAQVGQLVQRGPWYEILAIFEADPYIIFMKAKSSDMIVKILVDKKSIVELKEFD